MSTTAPRCYCEWGIWIGPNTPWPLAGVKTATLPRLENQVAVEAGSRPNIVVVLADQLRRQALGCYGDPNVATPAIDALSRRGARFANAVSTYPICVPFRFTLMTGQYAHTRLVPSIGWRMSPAERTLADEFNAAGYETAYFGKWHLYGGRGRLAGPGVFQTSRAAIPSLYRGRWQHFAGFDLCNDPCDTDYFVDDEPTVRPIGKYQTDGIFGMANDYLRDAARHDAPFAAVVSVEPPHPPLTPPEEFALRWRDRELQLRPNVNVDVEYPERGSGSSDVREQTRRYYAMVENLDANVGRLIDTLRNEKLLESTIVVLTSDHGELLGSHGLVDKQYPYEESIGIPLIVTGAAAPAARPRVIDDPVCTEDLFPTLLGLVGLPISESLPGLDLSPLIRGEAEHLDREAILLEFVDEQRADEPFHGQPWRAVRTARHKYTTLAGNPWQLFDLEDDPYEQRNLVGEPERQGDVARHHEILRQLLADAQDHYSLSVLTD